LRIRGEAVKGLLMNDHQEEVCEQKMIITYYIEKMDESLSNVDLHGSGPNVMKSLHPGRKKLISLHEAQALA
jgi:hypothetical protein